MTEVLIIALDPGELTGMALGWFNPRDITGVHTASLTERGPLDTVSAVEAFLLARRHEDDQPTAVVCESFIPRPGIRTWQPAALETIGALRYVCRKYGVPFTLQSPADAKRFSTNEKLKTVKWFVPTSGGHQNDAARHLLLYCVRHGYVAPEVFV